MVEKCEHDKKAHYTCECGYEFCFDCSVMGRYSWEVATAIDWRLCPECGCDIEETSKNPPQKRF